MSVSADGPEHRREVADDVAVAAMRVAGVAGLHAGQFGEVATYLPGRRVTGVRLTEHVTEVHVSLVYGVPVLETAERIREAVRPLVATPVEISIEDLVARDARGPA